MRRKGVYKHDLFNREKGTVEELIGAKIAHFLSTWLVAFGRIYFQSIDRKKALTVVKRYLSLVYSMQCTVYRVQYRHLV